MPRWGRCTDTFAIAACEDIARLGDLGIVQSVPGGKACGARRVELGQVKGGRA